ncbi:MAG: glycosyltransferase family 2 protein [Phycisphaerae bacterium]|nr:glycosyltransferase family 2 protein [Tepidisphaeraceae bacterium]
MKLVVTIPALNEEKTIYQVVKGVPRNIPGITEVEVLVLNDGSTDATAEEARRAGAIVVNLPGKQGLGHVFKTGLERAMRRGADVICNIDGDGQFNPGDIPTLIKPILEDKTDFVTCTRFADPALKPKMPVVKYWGNQTVTRMINYICGGKKFTDVSCGFRAFNREAAYRLTLFGKYTYTQETFIDLVSKGVRMAEVPLKVRGVREFGKSRVASSILKYATNSFPIMLRAMRDIQPLKFFGGIALMLAIMGLLVGGFVAGWYIYNTETNPVLDKSGNFIIVNGSRLLETIHKTTPFTSFIPIAGVLVTLSFLMGALALLADMMGRHRKISEEMLYLARRRVYSSKRTVRVSLPPVHDEATAMAALSLHDSWTTLPVIREIPHGADDENVDRPAATPVQRVVAELEAQATKLSPRGTNGAPKRIIADEAEVA